MSLSPSNSPLLAPTDDEGDSDIPKVEDSDIDESDNNSTIDSEFGEARLFVDPDNENGMNLPDDVMDEDWEKEVVDASMSQYVSLFIFRVL